jgi:hypothetical protein
MTKHEHGRISLGWNKSMITKSSTKACMPCARGLLEAIKRLDHVTWMIRLSRVLKTGWLTHINLLLKNTMKERVLNIKLAKMPTVGDSHGEKQSNSSSLYN